MGMNKKRLSGTLTVEASFVVSILVLIIVYQTGFILSLYERVDSYGKECVTEVADSADGMNSVRLTRIAMKGLSARKGTE